MCNTLSNPNHSFFEDAERQAAGSNLRLTTSVQPAAIAPIMASGTSFTTNENTPISFMPAGNDPQGYPIFIVVNTLPANGTLQANVTNPTTGASTITSVVLGTPYALGNTTFIYSPMYLYWGSTTMSYYGTNMQSATPSPNTTTQINTAFVNRKACLTYLLQALIMAIFRTSNARIFQIYSVL